jgi:hypothetical protein
MVLPHSALENCATEEQTLAFCNAVREAGGAGTLGALLPSFPSDASACLIAKGLNFGCEVKPYEGPAEEYADEDEPTIGTLKRELDYLLDPWVMVPEVDDGAVFAIADAVECRTVRTDGGYLGVVLPEHIANVARCFDETERGDTPREHWVWKYAPRGADE